MVETLIHFDNAPIVEAIIGIQLRDTLTDDEVAALRPFAQTFCEHYPIVEDSLSSSGPLEGAENGLFVKSADGRRVAHLRQDGFAFSQLAPYTEWDEFRSEAKRLWHLYRRQVGDVPLSRFSVRYLNQMHVPVPAKIEDYLNFYPHIPDGLPQNVLNYFAQVIYPLREPYQGSFTQRLSPSISDDPSHASFILDHNFVFATEGLGEQEVWDAIEHCRKLKNDYFIASITEKMKESFT